MPLTTPSLATVTPGEPVTAQGWNALVTGLAALYEAVIALGGASLEVAVAADADDDPTTTALRAVTDAQVTAEPLGDGRPVHAVPPFGARTSYLLVGLTDGDWRGHVEAPGYGAEGRTVTLPQPGPRAVALTRSGVVVPDLFNVGLQAGLDLLRGKGIDANLVVDTTGREISRSSVPPESTSAPILAQLPPAGTVVPTGMGQVRLTVASALRRDPVVTMPSLVGLNLAEAAQVLERLGLQLGTSQIRDIRAE